MPTRDDRLAIGEVLKRTRARQDLDIRRVEDDTKIRAKYLRALENEEWDTLPGPTYVRGFLRTYSTYLGLDADAIVDAYRRTSERLPATERPYLFSEPLLERRRRPGEPQRRSWGWALLVLGAIGVLAVAVFVAIGLTGGSDGERGAQPRAKRGDGRGNPQSKQLSRGNGSPSSGGAITLALTPHDDMVVCLSPGHGRPLIDSQTLVPGAKQGPFVPPAENYRLDLVSGGAVTLALDGKHQRLRSRRPASFKIDAGGVNEIDFRGRKCP
jgi:cytoskeleton protein RodZ